MSPVLATSTRNPPPVKTADVGSSVTICKSSQGQYQRSPCGWMATTGNAWLPPPGHPLRDEFKLMQLRSLMEDYGVQKDLLDKLHENRGEDIFVGTYSAMQNENTGAISTYAVWTGDLTAWMPRADTVAFIRTPESEPPFYDWEKSMPAVGDLMKPLDIYPPRFLVNEFPAEERFTAMGEPESL